METSATAICSFIDPELSDIIHKIIMLIKIATPIALVIFGMIDLMKGVIANKEDEIKKGQKTFISRLIAGVIVFLIITITQLVIGLVSNDDNEIWTCANQIMNGTNTSSKKYEPSHEATCTSPVIRDEYGSCLSKTGSKTLCVTIFQQYCSAKNIKPLWEKKTIEDETIIKGYECKAPTTTQFDEFYQSALYSCVADENNNLDLASCASKLTKFCGKKEQE